MTTTPNTAGSSTGINLAALEQLARAHLADDGWPLHPLNKVRDLLPPASMLELIALARATPQHSVTEQALRFTSDGALAECPCCGSLDVGGAHNTVHCYSCDLTIKRVGPLQNAIDAWNRRTRAQPLASIAATQPEQASDRELLSAAIQRARVLAKVGMEFGAKLCHLDTTTIKGVEYLPRDSVMSEVVSWRAAFDAAPKVDGAAVRAALAIPASTAPAELVTRESALSAIQHVAESRESGKTIRAAHMLVAASTAASEQQASVSGINGTPFENYAIEDQAFFTFWYSHMKDEVMQPPLSETWHSTARYIWDAALAQQGAAQAQAGDARDAARYRFVKSMSKETLLVWRGMYGCADEAVDAAMAAPATGSKA